MKPSPHTNISVRIALIAAVLLPLTLVFLNRPLPVSAGSCAEDLGNLLKNGMMAPGAPNQYGVVARDWTAFVVGSNVPEFENAANEGWDPYGSQYIWADLKTFDAGIYQRVTNLTPGQIYHYWLVWGQALHDIAGNNVKAWLINRQLGVDLTGGTDPNAPTVIWTIPYWDGGGFNRPEWNLSFTALNSTATFFLRVQNEHTDGRNKVFFDVACLYPASNAATTTPWSTSPTPTETSTPDGTRYDDSHASIRYKGAWTPGSDPLAIDSTYHYAQGKKGQAAVITFNFTGNQITIWYIGYKNRGKARVTIDGVRVGVIDQYSPAVQYNLSRAFGGLADGAHRLQIRNAGAKNVKAVDSVIVLDAIDVSNSTSMGTQSKPLAAIPNAAAPTVQPSGTVQRPFPTVTPRRSRPQLIPFSAAAPVAPTPDDPNVVWDARLPELNVYLDPANILEGTPYWKLIRADYHDPFQHCGDFGGDHFMYYVLTDEVGGRVVNQRVWQGWPGDSTSALSDMRGLANIALWANYFPSNGPGPYSGWVDGLPSDTVRGMGLPANNHVSFVLYFQRTIKSAYTPRTATPTGVWSLPTPSRTPTLDCSIAPTVTNTPKGPTRTATPTRTASFTPTNTHTFTPSATRTDTLTWTPTRTATVEYSRTPTKTPTIANTKTPSRTPTITLIPTDTFTPTSTPTTSVPSSTPTGAACAISVIATTPLSDAPKGIAVDAATQRVFVGLAGSSSVAVIDGTTNQVTSIWETDGSGSTNGVAFAQGKLFVTKRNSASVSVLDATTGAFVTNIAVGNAPYGIAANNDFVWVANFSDSTVSLIDARTNQVLETTSVDPNPSLVAALADRAFVTAWSTGVNELNSGNELIGSLQTGEGTYGIAANANAQRLYVGIRRAKSIVQFDTATGALMRQTKEPFAPFGLAVNPTTGHLFIVAANFNQVRVRGNALQWFGDVTIGMQGTEGGDSLAVLKNKVYVANNADNSVSVIRDCAGVKPIPEPTATPKPTRKPTRAPSPTFTATVAGIITPTVTPTPEAKCLRRPKLLAPAADEHVTDLTPLLDWNDPKCATSYEIQLRRGNQNGATVVETTTISSEYEAPELKAGKKYYFRSRACHKDECSPWALWRAFYVE